MKTRAALNEYPEMFPTLARVIAPALAVGEDMAAGWERITDQADDATLIPRLEVYSFHSRILPEPSSRHVLVYLPVQYGTEAGRQFPVFYLHDGQNLFDPKTSYIAGRTWRAHSTADRLTEAGKMEPVILVGTANAGMRRMAEYTPTRDWKLGGGEGPSYGRMLIEEIKPLVDSAYRTLAGPKNTALGGSSLGGLISLYLGLARPDVFGKVAVMSPSLWWNQRSIMNMVKNAIPKPELRIWVDMGTAEGAHHVRDTGMLHRLLLRKGWHAGSDLGYLLDEGAVHDEDAWAARFDRVLMFLFANRD